MSNIKVTVEYDGTNYYGWQRQKDTDNTIQQVLEDCLTVLNKKKVQVIGAGRTDSGVHAEGQTANFELTVPIPIDKIPRALNSELPPDIRCLTAEKVSDNFHARYHTTGKKYRYRLLNKSVKSVFRRFYVYTIYQELDFSKMRSVLQYLQGTHDFSAFKSQDDNNGSNIRTIKSLSIVRRNDEHWIEIVGDGFLYNMVRIIAGTLIEIGLGKMSPEKLPHILKSGRREEAGYTAPAKGLTLVKVFY